MFRAEVLKVIDKESLAYTSGTASATSSSSRSSFSSYSSASASVSNTITTDHIQNVTFESLKDPDDILRVKFINEEFQTAVGKNTAVYFMNDQPIAYIPSKRGDCFYLGYLLKAREKAFLLSFLFFVILCIPFINIVCYLYCLKMESEYYSEGVLKIDKTIRKISIHALVALFVSLLFSPVFTIGLFFLVTFVMAIIYSFTMYKIAKMVSNGVEELKLKAVEELEKIRAEM